VSGTAWTRIMFERQVLGEDYSKSGRRHRALPPGAPPPRAGAAKISIAPLYNIITRSSKVRPAGNLFAPRRADHPYTLRRLFDRQAQRRQAVRELALSKEGQAFQIAKLQQHARKIRHLPQGLDPKVVKVWVPDFKQFEALRDQGWAVEQDYGYRP
jgi:iron(III) transport system substrate-binding protein